MPIKNSMLIILCLLSFSSFARESNDQLDQIKFITDFYKNILDSKGSERESFYSKSLLALEAHNRKICKEKSRGDDMCGFGNGDVFLNTQESSPELNFKNSDFKAKAVGPELIEVDFTVWPGKGDYYSRKIQFKLTKENSSWRVDDMIYKSRSGEGATATDEGSMRKQILLENNQLIKQALSLNEAWSWVKIYISNRDTVDRTSRFMHFPVSICNPQGKCTSQKSLSKELKNALLKLHDFYTKNAWPVIDEKTEDQSPRPGKIVNIGPLTFTFTKETWWLTKIDFTKMDGAEKEYIKSRESMLKQFKSGYAKDEEENNNVVHTLNALIGPAVGPVKINDFTGVWNPNLQTFLSELGYGRADGLVATSDSSTYFVSTPAIISSYLGTKTFDFASTSKNEKLLAATVDSDAAVTIFFEIPLSVPKNVSKAKAVMALAAQDIGPFEPHDLVVTAVRDNQIFLLDEIIRDIDLTIPVCTDLWNQNNKMAEKAFEKYKDSQLEDKKSIAKMHQLQKKGFEAFQKCFRMNAKKQKYFPEIVKRAQKLLNKLQSF